VFQRTPSLRSGSLGRYAASAPLNTALGIMKKARVVRCGRQESNLHDLASEGGSNGRATLRVACVCQIHHARTMSMGKA
jgi:hypothetical protein